jgi:hypothetical protein
VPAALGGGTISKEAAMAWQVTGKWHELCSCNFFCPCWFGPAEPDKGWCSGTLIFDIEQGNADGVDLGGRAVVFTCDWPGDFWAGNGTARLYLDERATADQRRELEAIFSGRKGGPMEPVAAGVVATWLPAQTAAIAIAWGDTTTATVGDVGRVTSQRLKGGAGEPATVQGAAAMAAFGLERLEVARAAGSHWADPDLREWDADSGTISRFDWRA